MTRRLRRLFDMALVGCLAGVTAFLLAGSCPGTEGYPAIGFSTAEWNGTPAPAPGYTFGVLDASTGVFAEMCTFTKDAAFPDGQHALSNGGTRHVGAFWYLTSYAFAQEDCSLDLDWCGGAYCWGYVNAYEFYNYVVDNNDYCGQTEAALADVEYIDADADDEKWLADTTSNNRAVVYGFISHLKSLADNEPFYCGKYLIGVYSRLGAWADITENATYAEVAADWFWMADYTNPTAEELLSDSAFIVYTLGMGPYSWQYADSDDCDASDALANVSERARYVWPRVDLWQEGDASQVC